MTPFEVQALAALERIREQLADQVGNTKLIRELLASRAAGEINPLEVIHRHVGAATFTSGELAAYAARPANGELREALGESDSRQLGRLLGSIAGRPIGGFRVEAVSKEHSAVIWCVQPCGSQLPVPIAPPAPPVMLRRIR